MRRIVPIAGGVSFGSNEFHPEPQWLLRAMDPEKNAERTFATRDIHAFDCELDGKRKA